MWTAANYLLISYIFMGILASISLIANGFILIVIITNGTLRKDSGLYLLIALSIADFLLAVFILPYIVYLLHGWHADINYDARTTILLHLPIIFEIKISSVLTVAIAFDRFSALYWPVSYRQKRKGLYAIGAMTIGILWALGDGLCYYFLSAPFLPKPGCGAAGCFMSVGFEYYWGVSDMFINVFAMVITVLVLFKIRAFGRPNQPIVAAKSLSMGSINNNSSEQAKFKNASRTAAAILLCSGLCIFIPSVISGVGEMTGLKAFRSVGPFVAVGLLASGIGNAFIVGSKHIAVRRAIRLIGKKNTQTYPSN